MSVILLYAELNIAEASHRPLFQGGFIPDTILYLSYFYPSRALPIRLAWYWMSSSFVDIITGFAAVGLLKMRGIGGHAGWRWMFLIEGLFTR